MPAFIYTIIISPQRPYWLFDSDLTTPTIFEKIQKIKNNIFALVIG